MVDYSHGLSHVVALLLMWLNAEEAFWALVQLMENHKHAMHGRWVVVVGQVHISPQVATKPSDWALSIICSSRIISLWEGSLEGMAGRYLLYRAILLIFPSSKGPTFCMWKTTGQWVLSLSGY